MITPEARIALRHDLSKAVMRTQLEHGQQAGRTPEEFVPELIAALLSLAWFISQKNAGLDKMAFLEVCLECLKEELDDDGETAGRDSPDH